jgi:hypothetical protein
LFNRLLDYNRQVEATLRSEQQEHARTRAQVVSAGERLAALRSLAAAATSAGSSVNVAGGGYEVMHPASHPAAHHLHAAAAQHGSLIDGNSFANNSSNAMAAAVAAGSASATPMMRYATASSPAAGSGSVPRAPPPGYR